MKRILLFALGALAPTLAAKGARSLTGRGYTAVTHRRPPENPASRETGWAEAITWTLLVGAIAGLARLAVRRALSETPVPAEGDDLDSPFD